MIDDVVYMQRHGEIETRVLYIDSNERTNADEADSDFCISFDEPIRNVVGMKVIDSSIPAAMYTVDDHNNSSRMFAFGVDTADPEYDTSYSDFYAQCFLEFMSASAWVDETSDVDAVLVIRDYRAAPLPDLSTMPAPEPLVTNGAPYAITVLGPYDRDPDAAMVRVMSDRQNRSFRVAFHMDNGSGVSHKVFKRVFQFPVGFYTRLSALLSMAEAGTGTRSGLLANGDIPFLQGTSTPSDRLGTLDIMSHPWAVALAVSSADDDGSTGHALIAFDTTSSIATVIGFRRPVNAITCMGGRSMSTNMVSGEAVPSVIIHTGDLVDLSGERYITLRCPQIESAAYVGTGRRSQRGVALFKLSNPGQIRREAADYVNVLTKRFHPIAKLDRLNLRFERGATGELYNFRGTSPLIIIAVDVYVNKPRTDEFESTLNPEYNVDFHAYLVNRMQQDARIEAEAADAAPMTHERMAQALGNHGRAYERY